MVRNGVCHRDLKMDNLLVDKSGGFEFPLLAISDFGCCLVKRLDKFFEFELFFKSHR